MCDRLARTAPHPGSPKVNPAQLLSLVALGLVALGVLIAACGRGPGPPGGPPEAAYRGAPHRGAPIGPPGPGETCYARSAVPLSAHAVYLTSCPDEPGSENVGRPAVQLCLDRGPGEPVDRLLLLPEAAEELLALMRAPMGAIALAHPEPGPPRPLEA
jgi:hypothetical protein